MPEDVVAGRYRLLEPLGRSSMSAVWLAEDEELRRRVAVKTLAPTADRARFRREARAVAALSHPNICALYDYGEAEGRPYMVLELLPGGSLEDRLRRGRLADEETRRIAGEVAAALQHAHERGLVHRDLKPANILFDAEDRPKICDFGIARMGGAGTLTEAGTVLGTAAYISPEQASGLPATPASDVYSFGTILFRMLTGRLPFTADSAMELVRLNRDVPAPPIASVRRDVPADLAVLADASLEKDPAGRPADGDALLAALAGAPPAPPAATAALAPTQVLPRPRPPRRSKVLLPALALALVLLAGGAALALALTDRGGGGGVHGGGGGSDGGSVPSLSIPRAPTTATTAPAPTTAPTTVATTAATTAAGLPSTTTPAASTAANTTTRRTTTSPAVTTAPVPSSATTAVVTTAATTTAPLTTAATTTAATTTPATTTAGTTTAP